ncbi:hypothetical protein Tco_0753168 [Tanacetum coccineum]
MKRLADLKAEKEKSKKLLKKIFNPATIRAQTQKMISYVVNPNKEATMKITRGDNPLNLIVYPNFRLKTLESKRKFQWVINQSKKLGLPPPLALATFEMTAEDKKRKRTEIMEEVFVKENVVVDGMHRNLVPPPGIEARQGIVIRELESIQRGTPEVDEMFRKLELTIEARDDAVQARDIKEYDEALRSVKGGNTLTILLPFEEEQAELKLFSDV